jgi:hypothetical protein
MRYVVLVVSLVLLAYLVMEFNGRTAELNRLRSDREAVNERLESKRATKAALEAEIGYASSDAAAMKWGYETKRPRRSSLYRCKQVVTPTPASVASTPGQSPATGFPERQYRPVIRP